MKKSITTRRTALPLAMLVAAAACFNAAGSVLFTEEFPTAYGEGTLLGNDVTTGGFNTKWAFGNSDGAGSAVTTGAGALGYPTLAPIAASPSLGMRSSTGTSRRLAAQFAAQSGDGTTVYLSFLINVTAATPVAKQLAGFRNSTGGGNQASSVGISATRQLTIYKNSSNPSVTHPIVLNQDQTYLVVMRHRFQSGNDEVAVWLNPQTGQADESTAGVTPTTTTANSDQSSVLSLQLPSVGDASGALYLDEFRVTTTWAEATPAAGPVVAQRLAFSYLQPVSFVGQTLYPVIVQVQNNGGFDVSTNNVAITLAMTSGSGDLNGILSGVTDTNGRAVFTNLSFNTLGNGKEVTASSAGLVSAVRSGMWVIKNYDAAPGAVSSPVVTQAFFSGSDFILRGINGSANSEYRVLSSTNLSVARSQWPALGTNNFDGTGAFTFTNPAVGPGPQRFYLLNCTASTVNAFPHIGYASQGGPITGGGNTTNIVIATNLSTFALATSGVEPSIVYIDGTFELRNNGNTYLGPNKTIIGLGTNATLIGDLGIFYTEDDGTTFHYGTNVIIRNLGLTNPNGYGEDDAVTIKFGGHHVWVDHCTVFDTPDGLFDITREADFVTLSWCKFYYNAPNSHENIVLVGGDDGDITDLGKLHVTIHHNWFGALIKERMPSVRFGRAHVFNNYFNSTNNNYCTRTRLYAEVLVENNHYQDVFNPWELATSTEGPDGLLRALGNITNNCTFATGHYNPMLPNNGQEILIPGTNTLTAAATDPLGLNPPPYAYTLDAAENVQALVMTHSGVGQGPFAP